MVIESIRSANNTMQMVSGMYSFAKSAGSFLSRDGLVT